MKRTLIIPAAGLLFALTACGGGSGSSGAAAAPPSGLAASISAAAAGATDSPVAPASSGSSGGSVDVCQLLPASDVSQITGTHYTTTKPSSVEGQIFGCDYSNSQYALLQISVAIVNGALVYQGDVQALSGIGKPPTSVSGVGDKAFAMPDPQGNAGSAGAAAFASYGALFGDQYIKIGGSYVTPDQGKQIVEQIHGGL
jgi:hypothetical protein